MKHLQSKDLLGIKQLASGEIELILETAATMKHILSAPTKKTAHLQGKSIICFFLENSTRTRLSFELAAKYLGATSSNISGSGSSVAKGENLYDTAKTIDMMGTDMLIMRHPQSGAHEFIADKVSASIINAGDGMHEHPTQALLDAFTMKEEKGQIEGLKVAIAGDILHSRVVRSNIWTLTKLGAEVRVTGPATMLPRLIEQTPAIVCHDVKEACYEADVIMGLRVQLERQQAALFPSIREYARFFAIDEAVLKLAKPDAIIMHPGPCNHGVEMPTYIHEHERSVIHDQVMNGVAVRMAVLYLLNARRNLQ